MVSHGCFLSQVWKQNMCLYASFFKKQQQPCLIKMGQLSFPGECKDTWFYTSCTPIVYCCPLTNYNDTGLVDWAGLKIKERHMTLSRRRMGHQINTSKRGDGNERESGRNSQWILLILKGALEYPERNGRERQRYKEDRAIDQCRVNPDQMKLYDHRERERNVLKRCLNERTLRR